MKPQIFAVLLLGLAVLTVSAQTTRPANEAGLKIMRVELQRTVLKSPSLRAVASTDPASLKQAQAERTQDGNADRTPALHRMSQNAEIAPKNSEKQPLGNVVTGDPEIYVASLLLKNVGTKTVKAVEWEYLLFQTGSEKPVKRYRVNSKRIIHPGEQAELTKEVTPKGKEQQARILRVFYDDGTVWQQ